jgi:hypothetical protein
LRSELHSLNERLLTEIHALREQSESAESSKQILTEMLEQVIAERDEMKAKSAKRKTQNAKLASDYDQLFKAHLELRQEFKRTWKAGAGFFRLTQLFWRAYVAQILEPNEYTAQVASFTPKETTSKSGVRDFTENAPPVLMKLIEDIHFELIRRGAVGIVDWGRVCFN